MITTSQFTWCPKRNGYGDGDLITEASDLGLDLVLYRIEVVSSDTGVIKTFGQRRRMLGAGTWSADDNGVLVSPPCIGWCYVEEDSNVRWWCDWTSDRGWIRPADQQWTADALDPCINLIIFND